MVQEIAASKVVIAKGHVTQFAPYLVLQTLPWLLLATVLRLYMKTAPNAVVLLLFVLVQLSVFIAFLVACERMIKLSGGWTSLDRLTMGQRDRFAWQVIWRLLIAFWLRLCWLSRQGQTNMRLQHCGLASMGWRFLGVRARCRFGSHSLRLSPSSLSLRKVLEMCRGSLALSDS